MLVNYLEMMELFLYVGWILFFTDRLVNSEPCYLERQAEPRGRGDGPAFAQGGAWERDDGGLRQGTWPL